MPGPRHLKQPSPTASTPRAVLPLARRSRGRIPASELKPDPLLSHSLKDYLAAAKQQFREAVVRAVTEGLHQCPELEVQGTFRETLRSAYSPFWSTGFRWEGLTLRFTWGAGGAPTEWDLSLACDRDTQSFEMRLANQAGAMESQTWDETSSPAQIASDIRAMAERMAQAQTPAVRTRIA